MRILYTVIKIMVTGSFGAAITEVVGILICYIAPLSQLSDWAILYAPYVGLIIGLVVGMVFPAYPILNRPLAESTLSSQIPHDQ
jgi:hypothetical protein